MIALVARSTMQKPCVQGSATVDARTRASQSGDTSALSAGLSASILARTSSGVSRTSLSRSDSITISLMKVLLLPNDGIDEGVARTTRVRSTELDDTTAWGAPSPE